MFLLFATLGSLAGLCVGAYIAVNGIAYTIVAIEGGKILLALAGVAATACAIALTAPLMEVGASVGFALDCITLV